jgi:Cu/Ag efflux protein CusF
MLLVTAVTSSATLGTHAAGQEDFMTSRWLRSGASALALVLAIALTASAQKAMNQADAVTATFTITAIDSGARMVTLKDKDGSTHDMVCGPEVQRFNALKVGDTVTFRYYESVATAIRRSGSAPAMSGNAGVTRTPGAKPGGTIAQQLTTTVTIEAIDMKVPSVTVRTADGNKLSFKVEDKKNLEGYKAGDKVDVTYTQALAISVAAAK